MGKATTKIDLNLARYCLANKIFRVVWFRSGKLPPTIVAWRFLVSLYHFHSLPLRRSSVALSDTWTVAVWGRVTTQRHQLWQCRAVPASTRHSLVWLSRNKTFLKCTSIFYKVYFHGKPKQHHHRLLNRLEINLRIRVVGYNWFELDVVGKLYKQFVLH